MQQLLACGVVSFLPWLRSLLASQSQVSLVTSLCFLYSQDQLAPPKALLRQSVVGGGLQWILDASDNVLNLSLLARTEENVLTLRSDFMVRREIQVWPLPQLMCGCNLCGGVARGRVCARGCWTAYANHKCYNWQGSLLPGEFFGCFSRIF